MIGQNMHMETTALAWWCQWASSFAPPGFDRANIIRFLLVWNSTRKYISINLARRASFRSLRQMPPDSLAERPHSSLRWLCLSQDWPTDACKSWFAQCDVSCAWWEVLYTPCTDKWLLLGTCAFFQSYIKILTACEGQVGAAARSKFTLSEVLRELDQFDEHRTLCNRSTRILQPWASLWMILTWRRGTFSSTFIVS